MREMCSMGKKLWFKAAWQGGVWPAHASTGTCMWGTGMPPAGRDTGTGFLHLALGVEDGGD